MFKKRFFDKYRKTNLTKMTRYYLNKKPAIKRMNESSKMNTNDNYYYEDPRNTIVADPNQIKTYVNSFLSKQANYRFNGKCIIYVDTSGSRYNNYVFIKWLDQILSLNEYFDVHFFDTEVYQSDFDIDKQHLHIPKDYGNNGTRIDCVYEHIIKNYSDDEEHLQFDIKAVIILTDDDGCISGNANKYYKKLDEINNLMLYIIDSINNITPYELRQHIQNNSSLLLMKSKKDISVTESQLTRIVKDCVKRVLNEDLKSATKRVNENSEKYEKNDPNDVQTLVLHF